MSLDFSTAPYGRCAETAAIFRRFDAGKNLLMPGPRRLGKTFVLERLEERAQGIDYHAVRLDVAPCQNPQAFFTKLAEAIEAKLGNKLVQQGKQRISQILSPRNQSASTLPQALLSVDWENYATNLIETLASDKNKWMILLDELPIFLLRLHEQADGFSQARRIMYWLREICLRLPTLRWLITGSIGIEPLAREGNYQGSLTDFERFELQPLEEIAARTLIKDWAHTGLLPYRTIISDTETQAIVDAVGWLSAYYLEAFSRHVRGDPSDDEAETKTLIDKARHSLIASADRECFGVWPEHIDKHYKTRKKPAFDVLAALSDYEAGISRSTLLAVLNNPSLREIDLRRLLNTLEEDGFLVSDHNNDHHRFRMELLRLWWKRYLPE
ncbi:MAG: hypothetical protein ACOYMG_26220 [Candidatus Methylumidiphilus sp.]